jgi:release factor glutamine methyltransferase
VNTKLPNRDAALVALGRLLQARGYRFTTVTPATHTRVNARPDNSVASTLEDIFGWSRPFSPDALPEEIVRALRTGDAIVGHGNLCRSAVRFSTLGTQIFMHSAFPTGDTDAVFFGPDTYRFANALRAAFSDTDSDADMKIVDIGCGSGAGGLYLRSLLPAAVRLVLGDINPEALRCAQINAVLNRCEADVVKSDVMGDIAGAADIIIANPPYMIDAAERAYRHGGATLGIDLALRIVHEALPRLTPGGRLLVYTGAPVVDGVDKFREAVGPRLGDRAFSYEEIDPDVFGEELDEPAYARVDRIAAVVLIVTAPGGRYAERHAHTLH